jgi:hypothetical protein
VELALFWNMIPYSIALSEEQFSETLLPEESGPLDKVRHTVNKIFNVFF